MMTDPIADMLTRIRNALMIENDTVEMPDSQVKQRIAAVLKQEGFIDDYKVAGDTPHRILKIWLKYGPLGERVISSLQRVSKPGRRVYRPVSELGRVRNGMGMWVVSTNLGMLSDRECRSHGVGGEVVCSIY
jgi:small subunit ribosomal protein S8